MNDPTRRSSDASRSGVERPDDETELQLFAEELSVAKETLETRRVHICTHTNEREAVVVEDLARERVEIETIPLGVQIDSVPEVRQEGDTTIFPVVKEQLVVKRRPMLLRRQQVEIERVGPGRQGAAEPGRSSLKTLQLNLTRPSGAIGAPDFAHDGCWDDTEAFRLTSNR